MFSLANKSAVVTGAAWGIGYAIADLFLKQGARVLAVDLDGGVLREKFAQRNNAFTLTADVAAADTPAQIAAAALERLGGTDILVNNAGICVAGPFDSLKSEDFDRIMAVNVGSIFHISQGLLGQLKDSNSGRIINLGSIMSDLGGPALSIYGASKHAVAGLTKGMAVDLGQFGITVNYLQPGSIVTKMSEPFMDDPDFKKYWEDKAPVGRLGEADEVASAALFLASDEARFVSGTGLNVDGGAIVNF